MYRMFPHLRAFGETTSWGGTGKCTLDDYVGRDWTLERLLGMAV
jgi:hypothetical protein